MNEYRPSSDNLLAVILMKKAEYVNRYSKAVLNEFKSKDY